MIETQVVEQYRDGLAGSGNISRSVLYNNAYELYQGLITGAVRASSAAYPSGPIPGQLVWLSDTKKLQVWNGTKWTSVGGGEDFHPFLTMGG